MNQIDFLRNRYPDHIIGFSTHEYHDWTSSMLIAYAKGARTFERHVDIDSDGIKVSPYCSLPDQIDNGSKPFTRPRDVRSSRHPEALAGKGDRIPRRAGARSLCQADLPDGHILQR